MPPALTVSRQHLSQHAKRCQHDLLTLSAPLQHACHGADNDVHLQPQALLQKQKAMDWSTSADHVSTALQQRSKGLGLRRRSLQQYLGMLRTGPPQMHLLCHVLLQPGMCHTIACPSLCTSSGPSSPRPKFESGCNENMDVTPCLQAIYCRRLDSNSKRQQSIGVHQRRQAVAGTRAAAAGCSDRLIPPATSTCASWCSLPRSGLWTGLCTHSASHTAAPAAGSLCCLCTFDPEQGCNQIIMSLIAQPQVAAVQLSMRC